MKTRIVNFLIPFILLLSLSSCDRIKQKQTHPQSLMNTGASSYTDEKSISQYADSLDLLVPEFEKRQSMIYTLADYSSHITAYLHNGEPMLYIENGESNQFGHINKYYYLDKGKVILYKENRHNESIDLPYYSKREYFRNNISFYTESKTATNASNLNTESYIPTKGAHLNMDSILLSMTDALKREGKFNLVLEGITEDSRIRYIILSKPGINNYRAAIRVEKEDEFIKELVSNTGKFIGEKLQIDYDIIDDETVYKRGRLN